MKTALKYLMTGIMAVSVSGCTYSRGNAFDDIYSAAANNDTEALIDILDQGESLNALNSDNITPLCYAYMQNNETAIRNLQSYGANQGANCVRTKDGNVLIRYVPEHNPPQKQYPKTTHNSVVTDTILVVAAAVGGFFLISWL